MAATATVASGSSPAMSSTPENVQLSRHFMTQAGYASCAISPQLCRTGAAHVLQ